MANYENGMLVWFQRKDGEVIEGTVLRVNKQTVSVQPLHGSGYFRVPPSMLRGGSPPKGEAASPPRRPSLVLDRHSSGIGYTRVASEALGEGWPRLAERLESTLRNLANASGGDWVVFAAVLDGVDRFNMPAELMAIWFCGPLSELTDASWYAAAEPIRTGWTFEGQQTLSQGQPVPIRAVIDGQTYGVPVPGQPNVQLAVGLLASGRAALQGVRSTLPDVDVHASVAPTSRHLMALMLTLASKAMVQQGMPESPVRTALMQICDPRDLDALGELPESPSALAEQLYPCLRRPTAHLDAGDRQVLTASLLRLLTAAHPTEGALTVARTMAASVGERLPL